MFLQKTQHKIPQVLQVLFHKLRCNCEAVVDMAINNNYLSVKLFKSTLFKSSQDIEDYHVPAFRFDKIDLSLLPWDITFQHLIPQIDGVSNVKRIARQAQMDVLVAKRCLQLLVFQGCVLVTDAVRFSNVYRIHTEVALQMFSDSDLMAEMRSFSALDPTAMDENGHPTNEQLIQFYVKFKPGKKLRDIILEAWDETHNSSGSGIGSDDIPLSRSNSSLKSSTSSTTTFSSSSNLSRAIKTATASPTSSSKNNSSGATKSVSSLQLVGLNVCRAVVIGQARGILHRLHEYPLYSQATQTTAAVSPPPLLSQALNKQSHSSVNAMSVGAPEKKIQSPKGCQKTRYDDTGSSYTLAEAERNRKILSFMEGTKPGNQLNI